MRARPSPSWRSHTLRSLAFYTLQPALVPSLLPEPTLSEADRIRCEQLASAMADLGVLAHAIRTSLAAATPVR